jgi:dTDP-4-amino-4,6-dideoxygalactose transaminase
MVANHGQQMKYFHKVTGCNSRLDSIQAAILNIKLNHLDSYSNSRNKMAEIYDEKFSEIPELSIPKRQYNSTHVFHQYTLKVNSELRNSLTDFLKKK